MREKNNKIALVTGSTGGMGTAICQRLYNDGYTVVANHRNLPKALKWQEEQLKIGIDVKLAEGDVTDYNSVDTMIKNIEKEINLLEGKIF